MHDWQASFLSQSKVQKHKYLFTHLKIETMGKNVHVVPKDNSWAVKTEKSEKPYRVVDTQKEAIEIARELAKNQESELLIHGQNGQIRQRDSYGNDPFPPKDKN